jgi:hypothetical protein
MKTIYNILEEHQQLINRIDDNDGELTCEIEAMLSISEQQLQQKAVSIAYLSKHYKNQIDAVDSEIARLSAIRKRLMKTVNWAENAIDYAMYKYGIEKIEMDNIKISFRNSEVVEIDDSKLLSPEFLRVIPAKSEPDKIAIKQAIKEGIDVPGVKLITKRNLQIK